MSLKEMHPVLKSVYRVYVEITTRRGSILFTTQDRRISKHGSKYGSKNVSVCNISLPASSFSALFLCMRCGSRLEEAAFKMLVSRGFFSGNRFPLILLKIPIAIQELNLPFG